MSLGSGFCVVLGSYKQPISRVHVHLHPEMGIKIARADDRSVLAMYRSLVLKFRYEIVEPIF